MLPTQSLPDPHKPATNNNTDLTEIMTDVQWSEAHRNPPIVEPFLAIANATMDGRKLCHGRTVELGSGQFAGDFLRITQIIRDTSTTEIFLRGLRFRRTRCLEHMLIKRLNEVCLQVEIDADDHRPVEEQSAIQVPLSEVSKTRRLIITNRNFPWGQQHEKVMSTEGLSTQKRQQKVEETGALICRWRFFVIYASAADRARNKISSHILQRFTSSDVKILEARIDEDDNRNEWRGVTILGGDFKLLTRKRKSPDREQSTPRKSLTNITRLRQLSLCSDQSPTSEAVSKGLQGRGFLYKSPTKSAGPSESPSPSRDARRILFPKTNRRTSSISRGINPFSSDLSSPPASGLVQAATTITMRVPKLPGQRYTFGDAFCGSGGTTRGAQMAGLKVKWGFDFDATACESWRVNFPEAECFQMEAFAFINKAKTSERSKKIAHVDILHASCPCQFFSPAHTREGPNDEMNTASLFAVSELLMVTRPRIVTFEQTFGILTTPGRRQYFLALVHMLTKLNFSVRWKVVHLQTWGVPARRQRLIMVSSCPGEILPSIPDATHTEFPPHGSSLKPFTTANQALNSIPRYGVSDHDVRGLQFSPGQYREPWDGNKILTQCITTGGSGKYNYHPDGFRNLTVREYAVLQTYPLDHVFSGPRTQQIRQIGNSVPCAAAHLLFSSIRKELEEADGVVELPIIIDSNDEDDAIMEPPIVIDSDDEDDAPIQPPIVIDPEDEGDVTTTDKNDDAGRKQKKKQQTNKEAFAVDDSDIIVLDD
ncbi:S-adenosyl-L-methionine-dependent methyltransferase [Glarea lozoyensis ATCC 20868]|uniref:DNA (cytosine-5-)-methyltransferase n=1 Tax=Glarea lozoyensis (strain ATCC 20868 / MF5171) TaxID=1116229 RepID=S3CLT7_GLAL2|nr:S-adenosyl-L-methionine-dependent methyltransferase [Glarea lozoyensis ATCC 20868]EPE26680.1 S-adenosyl-L-methionine-dependent methyltransferase [Glarea lozoyensis ATCC 20868]